MPSTTLVSISPTLETEVVAIDEDAVTITQQPDLEHAPDTVTLSRDQAVRIAWALLDWADVEIDDGRRGVPVSADWIKLRINLYTDPRVARLIEATDRCEAHVVGALCVLWSIADEYSTDGTLDGLSLRQIDRKVDLTGIGSALVAIGWLSVTDDSVRIERFHEHNGGTAKARCLTALRQAKHEAKKRAKQADAAPGVTPRSADGISVRGSLGDRHKEQEQEQEEQRVGKGVQGEGLPAAAAAPAAPPPPGQPEGKKPRRASASVTFDTWRKRLTETGEKVAHPDYEVDALNAATIAGRCGDEIRALVSKLEAARKEAKERFQ